jgi:hypothetical protein
VDDFLGLGPSVPMGLPDGMTAVVSRVAVVAHSPGSAIVMVAA